MAGMVRPLLTHIEDRAIVARAAIYSVPDRRKSWESLHIVAETEIPLANKHKLSRSIWDGEPLIEHLRLANCGWGPICATTFNLLPTPPLFAPFIHEETSALLKDGAVLFSTEFGGKECKL